MSWPDKMMRQHSFGGPKGGVLRRVAVVTIGAGSVVWVAVVLCLSGEELQVVTLAAIASVALSVAGIVMIVASQPTHRDAWVASHAWWVLGGALAILTLSTVVAGLLLAVGPDLGHRLTAAGLFLTGATTAAGLSETYRMSHEPRNCESAESQSASNDDRHVQHG